jgi:outer membrane receptor protein involved in Fe transport
MFMPTINTQVSRRIETEEVTTLLNQSGFNDYRYTTGNLQTSLTYQLNSFHELTSSFRYSPRRRYSQQITNIDLFTNTLSAPTSDRHNDNTGTSSTAQWSLDYNRKFRNPNLEWNNSIQLAQDETSTTYNLMETTDNTVLLDERGDNTGANLEFTAQTDYLQKINDKFKFELGGKFISRNIQTISLQQFFNTVLQTYQPDEERSFNFPYRQQVAAAYAEGNYQLMTNWTLRTGLRLEHTNNLIDSQIKNRYTNLAPSLALNFISGKSTLTLSYARRLSRPGLSYLNPFENRSDPLNWRVGNPFLRPELADAFDFNFSQPIKQTFLNGSLFYHRTLDVIENQTSLLAADRTITTYNNIGNSYRVGLNVFFSSTLNEKFNLKGGSNLIYYNLSSTYLSAGSYNRGVQVSVFGMLSCQLSKGWSTDLIGAYLTPEWTAQQRNSSFYTYQLSIKKDILTTGSLNLTLVNPLNRTINISKETTASGVYSLNKIQVPLRMLSISFRYNLSKNLAVEAENDNSNTGSTDLKKAESNKPF